MIGLPVASRASLTAPSTASVPVTVGATRVIPAGASATSRSASSMTGALEMYWEISIP